jgi:hypothetical protein
VKIHFQKTLDLARIIDEWEEKPEVEPYMDFPSDLSYIRLRASGSRAVEMQLETNEVRFHIASGGDLLGLVRGAQEMLGELGFQGQGA